MSHPPAVIGAIPQARPGATQGIEDGTNEDASDGILVVQIRRFRTIYREIPAAAARVRRGSALAATACDRAAMACRMPGFDSIETEKGFSAGISPAGPPVSCNR